MAPRENLIKQAKHMTHLINIITPFSALEDRKVKAVHFNRSHILQLSSPVQKNALTLGINCRFIFFALNIKGKEFEMLVKASLV
jgi:hypothetical protein